MWKKFEVTKNLEAQNPKTHYITITRLRSRGIFFPGLSICGRDLKTILVTDR